jgi:hypothetical protein
MRTEPACIKASAQQLKSYSPRQDYSKTTTASFTTQALHLTAMVFASAREAIKGLKNPLTLHHRVPADGLSE